MWIVIFTESAPDGVKIRFEGPFTKIADAQEHDERLIGGMVAPLLVAKYAGERVPGCRPHPKATANALLQPFAG